MQGFARIAMISEKEVKCEQTLISMFRMNLLRGSRGNNNSPHNVQQTELNFVAWILRRIGCWNLGFLPYSTPYPSVVAVSICWGQDGCHLSGDYIPGSLNIMFFWWVEIHWDHHCNRICPNLVSVGFMCIRDVQRFRIRGRSCESGRVYYKIKGLRPIVVAFFFVKPENNLLRGNSKKFKNGNTMGSSWGLTSLWTAGRNREEAWHGASGSPVRREVRTQDAFSLSAPYRPRLLIPLCAAPSLLGVLLLPWLLVIANHAFQWTKRDCRTLLAAGY